MTSVRSRVRRDGEAPASVDNDDALREFAAALAAAGATESSDMHVAGSASTAGMSTEDAEALRWIQEQEETTGGRRGEVALR